MFFCFFIFFTYVESKQQNDLHNQAGVDDFQCLIWIFLICWLSPMLYNIDCSQFMSGFNCYQFPPVYLTVEHCPARNLQHKTLETTFDIFSQSQYPLHTLHVFFFSFFLHFNCIFTFLEIIKHNMSKICFFHLQY